VGRSAEYAQLGATYQTVCQGQPRLVLIEGEAGIGKTRLAAEFLNWLIFHGADVLRGRAFEAGGRLVYQPITEMIRERIEQENAPDDLLGDVWLAELSRLLPELRERYPDLPPPTADETLAQARLLEALARLGQALAVRRPLVWFIDDVQWADVASLDALSYLGRVWAERSVGVLLLFTIRTEALLAAPALNEWLVTLARAAPLTRLNLGPLTAAETRQLVETLQGGKPAGEQGSGGAGERNIPSAPLPPSSPAQFADWLFAETAGQPFYISETLKMLQEQGTLRAQADPAGHWQIDPAGNLPPFPAKDQATASLIPSGVRQIILARLNRLTPNAAALLTAAAVMGRPCRFERLAQVAGLVENEGLLALDELLLGRLLLETRQAARPYALAHDKIRDVVYTEAGAARRQVYHRRAFAALEARSAPASELAHHALAAQLLEPAFRYSLAAGDEAMALFAVRDAVAHYEQALTLATGDRSPESGQTQIVNPRSQIPNPKSQIPNLKHLYLQLGRAYELTNVWDKARTMYGTLLTLAQEVNLPEAECAALNRLATLAAQIAYDIDQATAFLQQAIRVAEGCGDPVALAEAEWNLAQIRVYIWDIEGSMLHAQRALALARQLDLPELTGRSLTVLGFAENGAARWTESESHYQEARYLYAGLGNRALEAESLCGIARARVNLGQAHQVVDLARTAHTFNLESDNAWGQAVSALNLGFVLLEANEWSEALAVAKAGVEIAQAVSGFAPLPILNLTVLGNTYRAMLALEAAQAAHREALAISESRPHQPLLRMTAGEMGVDCGLVGDWETAYRYARQSLAAHNHSLLHGGLYHWYVTEALLRGGDLALAQADAQRFGQQFGHSRRYQIPYRRCLAVLAQWAGDMGQAIEHLTIANTLAGEMDLPGEQWQILATLGELYRSSGEPAKADEMIGQAAEIVQVLAGKIDDENLRGGFLRGVHKRTARH
jgi:tetratricopeptide (TPR) repeat protein